MAIVLGIEAALKEILSKSKHDMERETAQKWASRAIASLILARRAASVGDTQKTLEYQDLAEDFRHEAVEHAGMASEDSDFETLHDIDEAFSKAEKLFAPGKA